jgi:hypothetical protein
MKNLAKFFLPSVFAFLPAVVCAQGPCGFSPLMESALANEITGMARGRADVFVYLDVFEHLEDGQNCLNDNLGKLKESVEFEKRWGVKNNDIRGLLDELKQTKDDLHTAETKIETLENRLMTAEDDIQQLKFDSRIPPHPANRKVAANKPSGFIPDIPATTPHPAIKKSDASKPKAPVNNPTPIKPKAPASKPTVPVNKPMPQ